MVQTRQYDEATAIALMEFAFPEYEERGPKPYEVRADGIYANNDFRQVSPSGTVFDWTPADDMHGPNAPNPDTAPFLPIPFSAAQLAAAMLDGPGQAIQHVLDRRLGYPLDDEALSDFRPRYRWAREAIVQAYVLAANAQSLVGEFDYEAEARAHALAVQYDEANGAANEREGVFAHDVTEDERRARRERAAASVLPLKLAAQQAKESVDHAWREWRADMVRQLLEPPPQHLPMTAHEKESENAGVISAFYSRTFNIEQWARHPIVAPAQAAQLLCGHDPLDADPGSRDAQTLAHLFEGCSTRHPGHRTLLDWVRIAREYGASHTNEIARAVLFLSRQDGGASTTGLSEATAQEGGQALSVQPQAASHTPVASGIGNGPLPLTTGDIAHCFDGIRWSEQQWRKPLGDKPKWLQNCVAIPGQRGVSETRWNPVLIAASLVSNGHSQARSVRARFQTRPQLQPWLDAWETYEADNIDTP